MYNNLLEARRALGVEDRVSYVAKVLSSFYFDGTVAKDIRPLSSSKCTIAYKIIHKNGNSAMKRSLKHLEPASFNITSDCTCTFTLVRALLQRFVSGYQTFEYRP